MGLPSLAYLGRPAGNGSLGVVFVGGYALIKGQVTEKLALRHAASLGPQQLTIRPVPQLLPKGLNACATRLLAQRRVGPHGNT